MTCSTCKFSKNYDDKHLEEYEKEYKEYLVKLEEVGNRLADPNRRGFFSGFNNADKMDHEFYAIRLGNLNKRINKIKLRTRCQRFPQEVEVDKTYQCGEYQAIPNREYKDEYK